MIKIINMWFKKRKKKAGFRIELILTGIQKPNEVIDLPHIPRNGDLIEVSSLVDLDNYNEEEIDRILNECWGVHFISWKKDRKGFYVIVYCNGE